MSKNNTKSNIHRCSRKVNDFKLAAYLSNMCISYSWTLGYVVGMVFKASLRRHLGTKAPPSVEK